MLNERDAQGSTGPLSPDGVRQLAEDVLAIPPADRRFGETLVRERVLSREQLQDAVAGQQALLSQGVTMRLGEVLVAKRLLTPDQVRQFLHLADKQLLHCTNCGKNYNVKNWRPGQEILCPTCSIALKPPPTDRTIDAHSTKVIPPDGATQEHAVEGQPFGRYRLLKKLGQGGMGVVWKAWDTQLKRVVALKQILVKGEEDREQIERFTREAQLAAKLRHPHIIAVYDVGVQEGQHYFTSEYVAGQSLEEAMKGKVSPKQGLSWAKDVAEALAYAHEQGVVHRDVKPANVLIDGNGTPFVMDFGLAKEVDLTTKEGARKATLTAQGAVMGTPMFMSPEQAAGQTASMGPATDQFSLGVMLYQMLTKRLPFAGKSLGELFIAIMYSEPKAPSKVNARIHRDVETICLKALEKDPKKRYSTMADLAADLGRYLDGEPIHARPVSRAEHLWRTARKRKAVLIPSAAAVVLGLALGAWALFGSRSLHQAEAEKQKAETSQAAQSEAIDLVELGRKGIDAANLYLYNKDANYEELVKKVEVGQPKIEEAIAKFPNLAIAHYLLGKCWDLRGWDDKAEACWRKAIELRPEFGPAHYEIGRLLMMRSFTLLFAFSDEELEANRPNAQRLAKESGEELETSERGCGLESPLQRAVGEVMKAEVAGDSNSVRLLARSALAEFSAAVGVEDLHWLLGLAESGSTERLAAYDRALALCPKHQGALLARGLARQKSGDAEGAIRDCTEALNINPRCFTALVIRAQVRGRRGEFRCAVEDYTEALKISPRSAEALCNRSGVRRGNGDLQGAIEDSTKALEISPRLVSAYVNRGAARAEKSDLDGAFQDYAEALKIEPRCAEALVGRGAARAIKGDLDGAIQDYTEALTISPQSATALVDRSAARVAKGDLDGAIRDDTEALKIDPRDAKALAGRGNGRGKKGDFDGAIQDYAEALKLDPRLAEALVGRGSARGRKGDLDGAIQDYTEALNINPRLADAFVWRGAARKRTGDFDGAIQDCTEALKINPRFADAYVERGNARADKGDRDGAIEDYTEALNINPRLDLALVNRADTRVEKGDLDGAIQDYTEALRINPRDPIALANRGAARKRTGDFDGAIQDCTEALSIDPGFAGAFLNRGAARKGKGDIAGAADDFSKALDVAPANWPYRKRVEELLRAAREKRGK